MIPCKHCNTPNSLDSTFCKRCGTGLPEDDIAQARAKLDKIVADGISALNEGKIDEARAIAESATTSDPSSVSALSLKAQCHERRGEIAEALECAERIVELNPDSELDKIKRNQLRSALASLAMNRSEPNQRAALLAGVAAVVLILCCGLIYARTAIAKSQESLQFASNPQLGQDLSHSVGVQTPQNPKSAESNAQSQPASTPSGSNQGTVDESPPSRDVRDVPHLDRQPGVTLPNPNGDPGPDVQVNGPIQVIPQSGDPAVGSASKAAKKTDSGSVDPEPGVSNQAAQSVASAPPKDSQITINISGAPKRTTGGSEPAGNLPEDAKAFARTGNDQFQIGNYSGAAYNLEQALKNGGDPVSLNQRLAQSYQSLGRSSDAASAYQKCIAACTSALASGKGNPARIKAVKDACQTALSQIQGNN